MVVASLWLLWIIWKEKKTNILFENEKIMSSRVS